jgi:threonine-phosphate decarboxylase
MGKAAALKDYLATEHGLLIRDASNFQGLDDGFFRIAVQDKTENDTLIRAIEEWICL